ncbi:YebC/PmpR family DNA-binding transcriptional regulator [Candidatus Poribacteria bacterium]|nr:YebC/PmpR family DNA-binding transcriptional regulator [Candidatus Poribacteria bacterium]
MSGHSKWSTIKHKKGKLDAQRGKAFSKIIREIMVAARNGGGDPESNISLRNAVQSAKDTNMPSDTIKRAIQRGTGEVEGVNYEEVVYEGYGPQGVALLVAVLTDNKNRTAAEIRHTFSRNGGNMGEAGCVSWMFSKKGCISVDKKVIDEDTLMDIVLNAGASDMQTTDVAYEIYTTQEDFMKVRNVLEEKKIPVQLAEVTMVPQTTIQLEAKDAEKMLKLIETLEEHDDVQNVYANFDIDDEVMATLESK